MQGEFCCRSDSSSQCFATRSWNSESSLHWGPRGPEIQELGMATNHFILIDTGIDEFHDHRLGCPLVATENQALQGRTGLHGVNGGAFARRKRVLMPPGLGWTSIVQGH